MGRNNFPKQVNNSECLNKCDYLFNRIYFLSDKSILHHDIVNLIKCYQLCDARFNKNVNHNNNFSNMS